MAEITAEAESAAPRERVWALLTGRFIRATVDGLARAAQST